MTPYMRNIADAAKAAAERSRIARLFGPPAKGTVAARPLIANGVQYASVAEAADRLNVGQDAIRDALLGKPRRLADGTKIEARWDWQRIAGSVTPSPSTPKEKT